MTARGWLDRLRGREPDETDCGWCGDPFVPDNTADPEPFCTDHCQQYAQANPDYAPGAAGHDGVLHTPLDYAPDPDPQVPQVTCPDCQHTGPAQHSRDEAAQIAASYDQLIHRGRPTAGPELATDTPDTPAAGPGSAVEHGRTTDMPRDLSSADLDAMIGYAESNLPDEWTAYLDDEHPDQASAEQAMREDPASLWNQEAAAARAEHTDPGRAPDTYRHTPEQQHHDLTAGRDADVDALLSAALDRPRTPVLEHEETAGPDWRDHAADAAVNLDRDRGDDLTR